MKNEPIDHLLESLKNTYQQLVASGMDKEEAFDTAREFLGGEIFYTYEIEDLEG